MNWCGDMDEKMKTGTTTVGIVCKEGVVLASDTKATMGYLVASKEAQKIYQVDDKISITTAGGSGDTQAIIRMLMAEIKLYKLSRESEFSVKACATLLANILQSNRYYPLMAMLLIGGADRSGYHLYSIDPVGGFEEEKYASTGSGSPIAYGVLEDNYKDDMTLEEALRIVIRSIRSSRERDIFSGGDIEAVIINQNGVRKVEQEKIKKIIAA